MTGTLRKAIRLLRFVGWAVPFFGLTNAAFYWWTIDNVMENGRGIVAARGEVDLAKKELEKSILSTELSITKEIGGLASKFDTLQAVLGEDPSLIQKARISIENNSSEMDDLTKRITEASSLVSELQRGVRILNDDLSDVKETVQSMGESLTIDVSTIKEDLEILKLHLGIEGKR